MTGTILLLATLAGFDFGADLRIRQEIMQNVPQANSGEAGGYRNQMRYRPRVWGEAFGDAGDAGKWRFKARLVDEFRWNVHPYSAKTAWPGEVIFDNLFIEGKGIDDGFMDVRIGRQDLYNYCGLNHVFMDGTPGDGSRTVYSDMASVRFNVDEESALDIFGLYNLDSNHDFRWGDETRRQTGLTARYSDGDGDQDDWGYGVIWGSKLAPDFSYQVFAMQKQMKEPGLRERDHTELVGVKLAPRWNETLTSSFEVMSELDCEWSAYADIGWKSADEGIRPFLKAGYHYMSERWDPMWARAVNDSEKFLYGSHDGTAWWSNMHYVKLTGGVEFGRHHALTASTGPMFTAKNDGVGGGDGDFKGELSQLKYEFPLITADKAKGGRFEIFGHALVEMFNPGGYWATEKTAWFVRWQIELTF